MAAVPGKRTFAEAMVSAADAVEGMDKLIDVSDGKYTEDDKKKDVKLVLRELNSFRKEVGPDRGEAREGTRTANARRYHSIVSGPHKYDLDEPLGDGWDSISAARGALLIEDVRPMDVRCVRPPHWGHAQDVLPRLGRREC